MWGNFRVHHRHFVIIPFIYCKWNIILGILLEALKTFGSFVETWYLIFDWKSQKLIAILYVILFNSFLERTLWVWPWRKSGHFIVETKVFSSNETKYPCRVWPSPDHIYLFLTLYVFIFVFIRVLFISNRKLWYINIPRLWPSDS